MSNRWRVWITAALGLGLLVALIAAAPDEADLLSALRATDPRWLGAAIVAYALSYGMRALRFRLLLHSVTPSIGALFRVVSVHNLFNMLMPVRTGELSYVYLVKKRFGAPRSEGAATLLLARLFDVFGIAAFFLAAFFATRSSGDDDTSNLVTGAVALLALSAAALFGVVPAARFAVSILARVRAPLLVRAHEVARSILAHLESIRARRRGPAVFLVTELQWLMTFLTCWCLLRAAGVELDFGPSVLGSTGLSIALILPLNSFGNVGTFEAGWVLGYSLVGLSHADAMATAISAHVWIFALAVGFGLLGWFGSKKESTAP